MKDGFNAAIDNRDRETIELDEGLNEDVNAQILNKDPITYEITIGLYIIKTANNNLTKSLKNIMDNHKSVYKKSDLAIRTAMIIAINREHQDILKVILDNINTSQLELSDLIDYAILEDYPNVIPDIEKKLDDDLDYLCMLSMSSNKLSAKSFQFFIDKYQDQVTKADLMQFRKTVTCLYKEDIKQLDGMNKIIEIIDTNIQAQENKLEAIQLSNFSKEKKRIKTMAQNKRIKAIKR